MRRVIVQFVTEHVVAVDAVRNLPTDATGLESLAFDVITYKPRALLTLEALEVETIDISAMRSRLAMERIVTMAMKVAKSALAANDRSRLGAAIGRLRARGKGKGKGKGKHNGKGKGKAPRLRRADAVDTDVNGVVEMQGADELDSDTDTDEAELRQEWEELVDEDDELVRRAQIRSEGLGIEGRGEVQVFENFPGIALRTDGLMQSLWDRTADPPRLLTKFQYMQGPRDVAPRSVKVTCYCHRSTCKKWASCNGVTLMGLVSWAAIGRDLSQEDHLRMWHQVMAAPP